MPAAALGRAPDHIDTDRDVVLDGNRQEGGRFNFEVGEGCGNGAGDVVRGAFDCLVEEHVGVVGGVAGELDFKVAVERGRCEAACGQAEANLTIGNCAPRVVWIMCRSRLLSPESKDLTGAATRNSHCPAWQTPFRARHG